MSPLDVMPRYGAAPANGDDAADGDGTPDLAQTRNRYESELDGGIGCRRRTWHRRQESSRSVDGDGK